MKAKFKVSNDTRRMQLEKGNEIPETIEFDVDFQELSAEERKVILRHSVVDGDYFYPGYAQYPDKPEVASYYPFKINLKNDIYYKVKSDRLATINAHDLNSLISELKNISRLIDVDLPGKQKELIEKSNQEQVEWFQTDKALSYSADWDSYVKIAEKYNVPEQILSDFKTRFDAHRKAIADKIEAEKRAREQREKEAKEARVKREKERAAWIKKHGSDRLKKMLEGGYELRQTYEQERTAAEYPGFELDAAGERFEWIERANPSMEALNLAEKHNGEVVWLEKDRNEEPETDEWGCPEYEYHGYEGREAVKIEPEWCRYALILEV